MPYSKIDDSAKLRRLLDAVLMIEADVELPELLRHFVEEACELVDARYGALGVLNEARTGLEQFLTAGLTESEEALIGPRPTGRGVLGLLITEPAPLRLDDLALHPDSYGVPPHHPPMKSFLGVPVRVRDKVYGNLYLTDKIGATNFSEDDMDLAEALAKAAGIAIENNRLHDRVRLLSVADDRDRIARDLHDRVIQRVFAVGMKLQEAARLREVDQLVSQVDKAVDDLDLTINEIRTAIYELGSSALPGGLRRGVLEIAAELAPMLGTRADVVFRGPVDNAVPQRTADNVLAVLREALTNAGKHARASRFDVTLSVTDEVTLEVVDNGVGIETSSEGNSGLGLVNLRKRAEKLHGVFTVEKLASGGTLVTWSVPV
ncbi:MAG TPA: GAF domain-containing sensor histidine kinase [Acidimicrobiales bacterium]|nr:GAF domain-containing sensor histidine kinase [Acidimicrobiales bacterium]